MARCSQYAVFDDGSYSTTGSPTPIVLGPTLIGTVSDGYTVSASFTTRPIDLGNVTQFAAIFTTFTGSTLAGTITLQAADDPQLPDTSNFPNKNQVQWLTLTNSNVAGTQLVASQSLTTGAHVLPFEYVLPGHRWIRFSFAYTSGSGVVSLPYTIKFTQG